MQSIAAQHFSRVILSSNLLFFIFEFQIFVSTYSVPIDLSIFSDKEIQDSSGNSKLSDKNIGIIDGISYRLDAWSQYDNPEEGNEREGDIHEFPESRKTTTRDKKLLWPKGVVKYWIHPSIRSEPKKLSTLKEAMKSFMEKTCVKFQEIFPDKHGIFPQSSWVNITGNKRGCFSDLGRSRFGASNLNLDVTRCFKTKGHAMHEILHTLGVYHEHMRPDRDDNIKIVWENIKERDVFNFRRMTKEKVTTYGLPYDYDSIMHYSMTAFAKNKSKPTIIPLNQITPIGQRDHLSVYDIKKLQITYKCGETNSLVTKNEINEGDDYELLGKSKSNTENSVTEREIENDNYDDEVDDSDGFNESKYFNIWSLLDYFNFGKSNLSPSYWDDIYFLE